MVSDDTTPLHGPGSEPVTDTNFGNRLAELRKQRGLTQQAVAAASGAHVTQIRRYEAGTSQPTLDVLRNLGLALNTSADSRSCSTPTTEAPKHPACGSGSKPSTSSNPMNKRTSWP